MQKPHSQRLQTFVTMVSLTNLSDFLLLFPFHFFLLTFFYGYHFVFLRQGFLCAPDCPGIRCVDLPVSTSWNASQRLPCFLLLNVQNSILPLSWIILQNLKAKFLLLMVQAYWKKKKKKRTWRNSAATNSETSSQRFLVVKARWPWPEVIIENALTQNQHWWKQKAYLIT